MKQEINVFDYSTEIFKALQTGVLLTTKADDKVNTMTIAWGTLGIEWSKPIFTAFIRENRFSRELLEKNPEFTISIPYGDFSKKILGVCGTKSGRDIDKITELGLTLETPSVISVPGLKELPLTLECRIIYRQMQNPQAVSEENRTRFYPQDVPGSFYGANRDYHEAYYGEIVAAYMIK